MPANRLPGLVSISFRSLSPAEIVDLCREAGLDGVEWGGDVHVPHGDLGAAESVRGLCRDAGLRIASYGSYYRLGSSEQNGLPFQSVLDSARALGAPVIRVWAGERGSAETDDAGRRAVSQDARRVVELAAAAGVAVAFEWHGNTLTDDLVSGLSLLADAPGAATYWQPPLGVSEAEGKAQIEAIRALPAAAGPASASALASASGPRGACVDGPAGGDGARLSHVHVFSWRRGADGGVERLPLSDGASWPAWFEALSPRGEPGWALLEFFAADSRDQALRDAATLRRWLKT